MTIKERASCINTIKLLQRLAFNVHGVMDVIDAENCDKIIKMLEQPTAQQWIPRSERLPSEDGEYLVTRYAGYLPKKIIIDIAIYCRIMREWQKAYPVIAWMPLPEAYKEVTE